MNITMNRAELLSAAQRAAAIASENAPLDILKGVLLEASAGDNTLTLTATNIETSLEQKLSCPAGEDDTVVMNAKLLAGMLGLMDGETVELRRLPGSHVLSLRCGTTGYDWTINERGEFPKMEIPFPEDTVKVSGIPSMVRRTMFATEDDRDKPLKKCVDLMFTQEGLKGAGYNGRSLFEDFIRLLGEHNRKGTRLAVNSFFIIDDEKQRSEMAEEFYAAVKKEIAAYQERADYLIKSGSQSPAVMERWVLKIQALEEKKKHYEEVLRRELDGLDDEFATLKFLGQELQVRAQSIRFQKAA